MQTICAKDYFRRVIAAEKEIKIIQARREHYMDLATGGGTLGGDARKAPSLHSSRVETAGIGLAGLAGEMDAQEREYVRLVKDAERVIRMIDCPRHRQVLELRYLCGLSWGKIAERMGYADTKSAYRVHGWALVAAEKVMNVPEEHG